MIDARLRRALPPLSLLLLLFLFVHACVPKPITDLRIAEVSRLPASGLPRDDDLRERLMREGEEVWKVTLTGDADWVGEVRQHGLNSYPIVRRCDRPDYTLLGLGPYLGEVRVTNYAEGFDSYRPVTGTEQYDVYLPETARYHSEAEFNAPMPSYDLGKQRMTLCIRIAGGAMHGAYNVSNEVRVQVGP